ncbi:MAG: H-NS family nucleoid-associated regulatory protein [Bacteroidota bacterium]
MVQNSRNQNKPADTWSGRGRPTKWVQAALNRGQTLSDLAIPGSAAAAAA